MHRNIMRKCLIFSIIKKKPPTDNSAGGGILLKYK